MRENSTTKKVRGEKRHGGKSTGNKSTGEKIRKKIEGKSHVTSGDFTSGHVTDVTSGHVTSGSSSLLLRKC